MAQDAYIHLTSASRVKIGSQTQVAMAATDIDPAPSETSGWMRFDLFDPSGNQFSSIFGRSSSVTSPSTGSTIASPFLKKVTLTPAQLAALDTTPFEVITNPGEGLAIQILGATARIPSYNGTPYNAAEMHIHPSNQSAINNSQFSFTGAFTTSTVSQSSAIAREVAWGANSFQVVPNTGISLSTFVPMGAGNSPIDFYFTYQIIRL